MFNIFKDIYCFIFQLFFINVDDRDRDVTRVPLCFVDLLPCRTKNRFPDSDLMGSFNEFSHYFRESFSEVLQLQPTLHRSRIPPVLHEPAIISGYRPPNQSWRYYLISLFQIHNETINVWSHLIGFVVIWIVLAEYSTVFNFWENKHAWPVLIFGITCLISSFMSACAHLLHSKSSYHHFTLFLLDYIGATLYAYGTGIQAFYGCSDRHSYKFFGHAYLPMLWLITWITYIVLCIAKILYGPTPEDMRRKCLQVGIFSLQASVVTLPFGPRYYHCYFDDMCSLSSLNHLTSNFIMFVLCAFFFGSHMPEKIFPGSCDIIGHGHQIFHIISTINQVWQFHAMRVDFESGASAHAEPDILVMLISVVLLIFAEFLSFVYLKRFIKIHGNKKAL